MNVFKKIFLISFALSIVLSFFGCKKNEEPIIAISSSKPNILLVIADDMGLDAAPGYSIGTVKPSMPNLQRLMDKGVRFNNLWSYPTCTPTRSTIITGKYGFRVNVLKVGDELSTTETSLQKYLSDKNSGYNSGVVGKWHLSNKVNHPTQIGVDYYAGLLTGTPKAYDQWNFTENGQTNQSTEYITTKFSDLAIDWIKQQNKSWFLWLAYTAPHTPFHLPPNNLHTKGNLPTDKASIAANPQPYYMAMLEALDTEMGRVLSSLSATELGNTIIIFIGDNGSPKEVAQEYNDKRVKGTIYQGGVNVPMIISGSGVSRINQTEDALISTADLFATIADIAGVNITQVNDSKSFKGLLTDESAGNKRDYVYTELEKTTGTVGYAIRNSTHKYIKFDDGTEFMYDLAQNPLETPNLLSPNQLPLSAADETIKNNLLLELKRIGR